MITTDLIEAARKGRAEIARLQIKAGADLNAQDRDGNTALIGAAFDGHSSGWLTFPDVLDYLTCSQTSPYNSTLVWSKMSFRQTHREM